MPDLKISQLPVASATTGAELFPVVQGGVTRRIALNAVRHIGSAVFDANGSMAVDTNTLFVDAVNNRVGIGTVTPIGALSVFSATGSVGFNYGTSVSPQRGNLWYDTDGSGWHLSIGKVQGGSFTEQVRLRDNGNLAVDTDTLFVDAVNNRVGIGTVTPASALDVIGAVRTTADGASVSLYTNTGWRHTGSGGLFIDANQGGAASTVTIRNGSGFATQLELSGSGNLGLGVTPSAWVTYKAIDLPLSGALFARGTGDGSGLAQNAFLASGGIWTYKRSTFASFYEQLNGTHAWFTAASGTAGNAITFTERLRVDATTTAGQTALLLWDVDNGTLERVTVGAADSAGVGFKVLRIPN